MNPFQQAAAAAQAQHGAPQGPQGPGPQGPDPDGQEDQQVQVAVAHLAAQLGLIVHVLVTKGVITPQDLGGGGGAPPAGPQGAPQAPPPGAPPMHP